MFIRWTVLKDILVRNCPFLLFFIRLYACLFNYFAGFGLQMFSLETFISEIGL
jgi:hypothetical protein